MEDNSFEVFESTFMYIQKTFDKLNIRQFTLDIYKQTKFDILFAYSFDGKTYTEFLPQEKYEDQIIDDSISLYVCIWFRRVVDNDLSIPYHLYDKTPSEDKYYGNRAKLQNVDSTIANCVIRSIKYDNEEIPLSDLKFKEKFQLVNEFPKWNFYDNQQITINRWLEQCNAIAEMYGHTVIYFKTEPVEIQTELQSGIHGIHHTLANNVIRNVVDIKKLHICIPNNELPQDRVIYSDWDMPLQDDFVIHVVRQKFEQAFGLKAIPNEKDYLYFPLINKMYRVSTMQPKNSFMGTVGWYEVFLAKYEEDDCVRIDTSLKNITENIDEIFGNTELLDETNDWIDDTLVSKDRINQETIEEKKEATQNFTNRLEDTTFVVSLKETEKLRELYDKRLQIVSVNPDESLFPINMYDCSGITKRCIAMRYNLTDYSVNNKFTNTVKQKYTISFDIAITGRFTSEIIDIENDSNIITSISCKSNKIQIFDTSSQTIFDVEFKLEKNELYQINIEYSLTTYTYSINIFKLVNQQKELVYQNVYKTAQQVSTTITNLNIYGGNYFIGNIMFGIDNQKFIDDKCLPLLDAYKF